MDETATDLIENVDQVVEFGNQFGPVIIRGMLLLVLVLLSAQYLGKMLSRLLIRMGVSERKALLPVTALHITFLMLGALFVLNLVGIPALNLVRALFSVAMAFLAVFIVIRPYLPGLPFSTGDLISQGSIFGVVERITFAHTMIRSIDGTRVVSPNHKLMGEPLVNLSVHPNRRADIEFFVPYDEDVDAVRRVVGEVLKQDKRVLDEPAPIVVVAELAPSYRKMMARFWIPREVFLATRWDAGETIEGALAREGLSLGVPRIEVVSGHDGQHSDMLSSA
jgi:small conductance mechanosensitive channel